MSRTPEQLRNQALQIWRAGVNAVRAETLIAQAVRVEGRTLWIEEQPFDLDSVDRIAVVGAGKASAGMADALEQALGRNLAVEKRLSGWVNVPGDCVRPTQSIHLHAARPPGVNEPTEEGVKGSLEILRIVQSLKARDLCICLLSGGGSALLPLPVAEISLADKLAVTKSLSAAGASIRELNIVRKQLSRIKGGGLAMACGAGNLITLVISDVLGDPLDLIASGPTVADTSTPQEAIDVLARFCPEKGDIPAAVLRYLDRKKQVKSPRFSPKCRIFNAILANNAVAVDGAGIEAERLGFSHAMLSSNQEGTAEEVGQNLAKIAVRMLNQAGPNCLISGGEPVVRLIGSERRGKGGRNQQLVLAAMIELLSRLEKEQRDRIVLLSGGTDGEDGPTDAAGALCDAQVFQAVAEKKLDLADFLRRNDAYTVFDAAGGLIKTGPTHTNVCDVRVIVVDREEEAHAGIHGRLDRE